LEQSDKVVVAYSYNSVEYGLIMLDHFADFYLSQNVMFVYEIFVGDKSPNGNECDIIFHLQKDVQS
jgi:hypothetical protein